MIRKILCATALLTFWLGSSVAYAGDAATAEARKSISLTQTDTIEWGTPVLYMRAPDGVLFRSETLTEKTLRLRMERQTREQARNDKEALKAQLEAEKTAAREKAARVHGTRLGPTRLADAVRGLHHAARPVGLPAFAQVVGELGQLAQEGRMGEHRFAYLSG